MAFTSVRVYQFRNLEPATVDTDAREVFLVGENGQGKTNLLEAVYFSCFGSSFRTRRNETLIRHGCGEMSVHSTVDIDDRRRVITIKQRGRRKEIEIDGAPVVDRKELVNMVPCIVFCHDDISFVTGGPEMQRWFVNQTLSLIEPSYLDELRQFNRVLRSRNAALKAHQIGVLDALDEQLVMSGKPIVAHRREVTTRFDRLVVSLFRSVFDETADLDLQYRPAWATANPEDELSAKRAIDVRLGTTTGGPHRDRFVFLLNGVPLSDSGSTGQMRLVSLILRVAQSTMLANSRKRKPVLLLDDVLLELDPLRRARFVDHLPDYEQAFFTFLPDEQFSRLRGSSSTMFRVEGGILHATN